MEAMRYRPYVEALAATILVTASLFVARPAINATTVSLALLLTVLFVAARSGIGPAIVASLLAAFCFNFFFLPPYHTLTIADPQNWIALVAFLVTAATAGQLSARARRRAEEAEAGRGEIQRLYTELRDAFDRASRAEALRQAEQMKSTLLDAFTHELRTPLTSIKASATTLLDEAHAEDVALEPGERQEMLEIIDEEADRLDRLIGNIVEIARIEAGQMELRRRWTSAGELVTRALERPAVASRGHALDVAIDGTLPSVHVDGRAVAEAIYMAIENAVKYSPPGSRIRIAAWQEAPGEVRIAIEDEGPGVPESRRDRAFEKFTRLEAAGSDEQPGGTGMGLAIARGLVEAHGGRIWLESAGEGSGTRAVIALPIGDEEADAPEIAVEV
jgi:two-component system sensor histidine kinase KdpD